MCHVEPASRPRAPILPRLAPRRSLDNFSQSGSQSKIPCKSDILRGCMTGSMAKEPSLSRFPDPAKSSETDGLASKVVAKL